MLIAKVRSNSSWSRLLIGRLFSIRKWELFLARRFPLLGVGLHHLPSTDWCASIAIDRSYVPEALGIESDINIKLEDRFPDWFARAQERATACPNQMGGAADLEVLYLITQKPFVNVIVETGVAFGWSSLAVLLALREKSQGKLISIDRPYPARNNDSSIGCVVSEELRGKWDLLIGSDRALLPSVLDSVSNIDLFHYDSDKSYAGRLTTWENVWPKQKGGSIFIADDIDDNYAFKKISESANAEVIVFQKKRKKKYVGILVKR